MKRNLEYKSRRILIDKSNVDLLGKMQYTRSIVNAQVNKIYKLLENGGHFDSAISVNKRNDTLRIIDGGHRRLAIKKWIEQDPDNRRIIVQFSVYEDLNDEEEIELFVKLNSGKKQSSDNYVEIKQGQIPILQKMKRTFPVKIRIIQKRDQDGIHFADLTRAYLGTKMEFPRFKVYRDAGNNYVETVKTLDDTDYQRMYNFCEFFEKTFGVMEKSNPHQTTTMLNCLITLYIDNVLDGTINETKFKEMCRRRIFNRAMLLLAGKQGGVTATENAYRYMVDELRKERNRSYLRTREVRLPASIGMPVVIAGGMP